MCTWTPALWSSRQCSFNPGLLARCMLTTPPESRCSRNLTHTSALHHCSDNIVADETLLRPTGLPGPGHPSCTFTCPTGWLTGWFLLGGSLWKSRIQTSVGFSSVREVPAANYNYSTLDNAPECCSLLPVPSCLLPSGFSLIRLLTMLSCYFGIWCVWLSH